MGSGMGVKHPTKNRWKKIKKSMKENQTSGRNTYH